MKTGYVWVTSQISEFPGLIIIAIADSPQGAIEKIIAKLVQTGLVFTNAELEAMKKTLMNAAPQILDLSGDVGLLTHCVQVQILR